MGSYSNTLPAFLFKFSRLFCTKVTNFIGTGKCGIRFKVISVCFEMIPHISCTIKILQCQQDYQIKLLIATVENGNFEMAQYLMQHMYICRCQDLHSSIVFLIINAFVFIYIEVCFLLLELIYKETMVFCGMFSYVLLRCLAFSHFKLLNIYIMYYNIYSNITI